MYTWRLERDSNPRPSDNDNAVVLKKPSKFYPIIVIVIEIVRMRVNGENHPIHFRSVITIENGTSNIGRGKNKELISK